MPPCTYFNRKDVMQDATLETNTFEEDKGKKMAQPHD
jgi:hypothetical protein